MNTVQKNLFIILIISNLCILFISAAAQHSNEDEYQCTLFSNAHIKEACEEWFRLPQLEIVLAKGELMTQHKENNNFTRILPITLFIAQCI